MAYDFRDLLSSRTATVSVDALVALLIHKGAKFIKAGEVPPPNTRVVEMVTPEGIRVKVRVPIEEPINPKGSNVLESRANNTKDGSVENNRASSVPREAITPESVGRVTVPGVRGVQFAKRSIIALLTFQAQNQRSFLYSVSAMKYFR